MKTKTNNIDENEWWKKRNIYFSKTKG